MRLDETHLNFSDVIDSEAQTIPGVEASGIFDFRGRWGRARGWDEHQRASERPCKAAIHLLQCLLANLSGLPLSGALGGSQGGAARGASGSNPRRAARCRPLGCPVTP